MEFAERLMQLAERVPASRQHAQTEEATKNALVMPFIQSLGYDVFNPREVVPEFTADVGIKRGEKVDYAVMANGEPIILFECKCVGADLSRYGSQLYRYFSTTPARIAVLTDGLVYRFYSDLDEPNKLDPSPFMTIDIANDPLTRVEELKKLTKEAFDLEPVLAVAERLKYSCAIQAVLTRELASPGDDFVRFIAAGVYDGRMTTRVIEKLRPLIVDAGSALITERVEARLEAALERNRAGSTAGPPGSAPDGRGSEEVTADEGAAKKEVETTIEELEGFYAVKAILREDIDSARITGRDVKSYFGVLLDDNNRKPICRLWFNGRSKYLGVFDAAKEESRIPVGTVDDIFKHADAIRASLRCVHPAT